jgi:hypothetical protein
MTIKRIQKRKEMTVLVLCDERGDVQSVAIPDPEFAGRINVETDNGGPFQKLDVDGSAITQGSLMGGKGDKAQTRAYDAINTLIRRSHKNRKK